MKLATSALLLASLCATAEAGHKVLIARADSSADFETRKRVEAAVLALARTIDRGAGTTEVTFGELATANGCTGDLAACKDGIAELMSVDEIVQIAIAPAGKDTVRVTVRRGARGGAVREASGVIPTATLDAAMAQQIGPLFGASAKAAPPPPPSPPAKSGPDTSPVVVKLGPDTTHRATPVEDPPPKPKAKVAVKEAPPPEPTKLQAAPPPEEPAKPVAEPAPPPTPATPIDEAPRTRNRTYLAGTIAGGVMFVGGLMLWSHASGIEDEVRTAPRNTRADIANLLDLEASGDRAARWGNVLVVGGVAVAGVCGYLYWRGSHGGRARETALVPIVVDGGAGIAIGGVR